MNEIFTRVSTRNFKADNVENKFIVKILRAAMASPSAANQQPWEFFVIRNKNLIEKLGNITPFSKPAGKAPVIIIPCYRKNNLLVPEMVLIDMAICSENILLEAEALNLGAVMIGIAPFNDRMKDVAKIINLPENLEPFMLIPVGYPVNKHPQEDRYEPSKIHEI